MPLFTSHAKKYNTNLLYLLDGPKVTNHSQFSVFGDKLFGLVNQNYCELINIVLYTKLYMLAISMKVCKSF